MYISFVPGGPVNLGGNLLGCHVIVACFTWTSAAAVLMVR